MKKKYQHYCLKHIMPTLVISAFIMYGIAYHEMPKLWWFWTSHLIFSGAGIILLFKQDKRWHAASQK